MTRAHIGLGSNVGDRLENLRRAVDELDATDEIKVTARSSVYETEAVGPAQPDFLNAVVEIETTLGPHELLEQLHRIEHELGRVRRERWGPREIDVDILVFGNESIDDPDLVVPHPRLLERAFVLAPLAELAPRQRVRGKAVQDHVDGVESSGVRRTDEGLG